MLALACNGARWAARGAAAVSDAADAVATTAVLPAADGTNAAAAPVDNLRAGCLLGLQVCRTPAVDRFARRGPALDPPAASGELSALLGKKGASPLLPPTPPPSGMATGLPSGLTDAIAVSPSQSTHQSQSNRRRTEYDAGCDCSTGKLYSGNCEQFFEFEV